MTKLEKIKSYEIAIDDMQKQLDQEGLPEKLYEDIEKSLIKMSLQLNKLKKDYEISCNKKDANIEELINELWV